MYTILRTREEISAITGPYRLCYIGEIPQTYIDDTPETKAFKQTEEFRILKKQHEEEMEKCLKETGRYKVDIFDDYYRHLNTQQYPNPEYVPNKYTHYAYFTPRDLKDQWGDDWDDVPYDCNAEMPYDDEFVIIKVPFYLTDSMRLPCYGYVNCPYSVEDINNGAVAWVYDKYRGIAINAGISPQEFIDFLGERED